MVAFAPLKNSHSRTIPRRMPAHVGAGVPANINTHRGLPRSTYDSHRGECYVDEPLALITPTAKYYYHANHLYSVAALTDAAKTVVERYRYDTYGNRTVLEADGVTTRTASLYGQQIGFTGRYLDRETGLWYYRTRMYSGTLGRFIERMPWFSAPFVKIWAWDPTAMSETEAGEFAEMLIGEGFGNYFQGRYNLYDYALGSPGNNTEPFSRIPWRPWVRPPTPIPPGVTGSGVRTPPRNPPRTPPRNPQPDRNEPESFTEPHPLIELTPNPVGPGFQPPAGLWPSPHRWGSFGRWEWVPATTSSSSTSSSGTSCPTGGRWIWREYWRWDYSEPGVQGGGKPHAHPYDPAPNRWPQTSSGNYTYDPAAPPQAPIPPLPPVPPGTPPPPNLPAAMPPASYGPAYGP